MSKAKVTITREILPDEMPDVSWLEGDRCETDDERDEDARRLEAFHNGEWYMTGVRAKAEIRVPYGHGFIIAHISSPGLWGVESDASEEYLEEIFQEEKTTLLEMLKSLCNYEVVE